MNHSRDSLAPSRLIDRLVRGVRRNRSLVAFAIVVLVLKVVVFESVVSADPEAYRTNDSARYTALASELVEHGRYAASGEAEVMRTPGYPLFLAAITEMGGSGYVVIIVQIVLAFAVAAMVSQLVKSRAPPVNQTIAAGTAFAIVILDPAFTSAQFHLMTEVPFLLFVTVALLGVSRFESDGEFGGIWLAFAALAIASFVRPIGLYVPLLVFLLWAARAVLSRTGVWKRTIIHCTMGLIVYGAAIGAWSLRNQRVSGIATFSSAGKTHLYETLAAASLARAKDRSWHEVRSEFRSHSYGITDNEAERAQYAWAQTKDILTEYPVEALIVATQGTITTLLDPGTGQFANFLNLRRSDSGLTSRYYDLSLGEFIRYMLREERALVALLAVGGIWTLFYWGTSISGVVATYRYQWTVFDLLLILMAGYFIAVAAGPSGMARYRIPALPVFAYYGGIGMASVWPQLRKLGIWSSE